MVGKISAVRGALLVVGAGLLAAGCGGAAQPSAGTGGASGTGGGTGGTAAASPAGGTTASTGAAPGTGTASCSGGLDGTEPGVVLVSCDGTARVHVQIGPVSKDFAGGTCYDVGGRWSVTDGVVTEKGTYQGPPVDVVSVNNQASGRGTIQVALGGKSYFVDNASFDLSNDKKSAHLRGKTTPESDAPGTTVTVDVAC